MELDLRSTLCPSCDQPPAAHLDLLKMLRTGLGAVLERVKGMSAQLRRAWSKAQIGELCGWCDVSFHGNLLTQNLANFSVYVTFSSCTTSTTEGQIWSAKAHNLLQHLHRHYRNGVQHVQQAIDNNPHYRGRGGSGGGGEEDALHFSR